VNAFGYDMDDVIYVPFSTALQRIKGRVLSEPVEAILVSTHRREEIPAAIEQVRSVLRERHGKGPSQADDFTIRTDVEMSGIGQAADAELTKMLAAVAAVSLLGAGIGIMNILLVSVTERTREIGVRMAVGAKRRHILVQFLIEAMTLSLLGGAVGIVLGIAGARLTTVVAGWPTIISAESVVVAFLFSLAVGLFFGLYPANKAARLNPIEALRYE
jgi:putative ABC transport system permease protein